MGTPQFYVRSNVHMTNLDNAIQRLLVNESLIDVTLACDGHKFQCHRLVLAAASPLFEELLKEHPKQHPIVIIPIGVKWHILKSLIDFMYRGQTCIDQAELKTLVESAELLKVIGLYDPQTQFREVYGENEDKDVEKENRQASGHGQANTESDNNQVNEMSPKDEEDADYQREHQEDQEDNVKTTESEDGKRKETIVDYIEIDDSQDESSQPVQGYLITKDKTTMTNDENTASVEIQTDSPNMQNHTIAIDETKQIENVNNKIVANTKAQVATTQTQSAAIETELTPLIRVKPTIKLINLFKLNQPGEANQGLPKVPWTYIHIPATPGASKQSPNEQVPQFVASNAAMPQLMQITIPTAATTCPLDCAKPIQESIEVGNTPSTGSVSSFLKFNSNSMAISVKNLDQTRNCEKLNVLNMALEGESNQQQQFEDENELNDNQYNTNAEPVNDEPVLDKIKHEFLVKTESMDLDCDRDIGIGEIKAEAETIICQPNISYIYDGNDEYGRDIDDGDVGVCIDYDRVVAETYGNLKEICQPKSKKKSNNKKCKRPKSQLVHSTATSTTSTVSGSKNSHQHNVHQRLKEPANIVPLSVMNAGHGPKHLYHYNEKTEDNSLGSTLFLDPGDNTMQDSSDSHTQNAVILRNPRCNQPRHYSNESLYAALMAVKYGDSIYRASCLHKVPRKTLRNWMKRWDIKSQYPMPKQLKDAAKKKKLSQNQST